MSGLYSSGSGSGKLGFDSVGMIFRLFLFQRFFKRKYSCHVLWEGMTVEVRTCLAFLADIVCSMPLSIGTLKIYVTVICRMDLKILSSQLKLLLLIFIQE